MYIAHIIYITHTIYINQISYISHITYIAHTIKFIFKAYKKLIKIFFINFFSICKNCKQTLSKAQGKTPERSTLKISKSF